jgi:hypothetical protein
MTVGGSVVDLGDLGFDEGGHLLVDHALRHIPPGGRLTIHGSAPNLKMHAETWARGRGHRVDAGPDRLELVRGTASRWTNAETAGSPGREGVVDHPSASWGVAARGAVVERGSPAFDFTLTSKSDLWSDDLAALYRQGVAAQWDPFTAIDWDADFELPDEIEDAVVQLMTYLVENENAALLVPARFLGRVHPHFKEVVQLLALQTADEARHVEVFTRRALLRRDTLGLSTAGGQASLKTLFDEPDFALAMFLLSVLGEGSFLALLSFIAGNAPDPVTARVAELAAQDEARHVAFGMAHLMRHASEDPGLRSRLRAAIEHRHSSLESTAGLNQDVFDALVLVAAGEWTISGIRSGFGRVLALKDEMDAGRRRRLMRLGFEEEEARRLSGLHTRNFM